MQILLKKLLKEVEEKSPLKVQIYCDMDGVLVDLEKGFKAISGGLDPKEYEAKHGKNTFWNVVDQVDPNTGKKKYPNFWIDLEPLPDATTLWSFIKDNFKDLSPVILSAGQGSDIKRQKTEWIRKHIDSSVKVMIAPSGIQKPNYIINYPNETVTHVLVDDTEKNIEVWNNEQKHRIAILHKNAANSISQLKQFI
jgi:hypothetical protein